MKEEVLKEGLEGLGARDIEESLIRQFERKGSQYLHDVPDRASRFVELLALMQHHGAPTRLLDATYSFFVALFFALKDAKGDASVFALDTTWLEKVIRIKMPARTGRYLRPDEQREKHFRELITRRRSDPMVFHIAPYKLNQRLTLQQGAFLCPWDLTHGFECNLKKTLELEADEVNKYHFRFKITCCEMQRREILLNLDKMNVNQAVLFPDLDGFSGSLNTLVSVFREQKGQAG